jgi:pimeloyl-ACP methyl ester carboxylesterase
VLRALPEFAVPAPSETAVLAMADGAEIRLRRYGPRNGTRLALSHGNGLAIDVYAPFWLPLAASFEVVVFDVRNHGQNALHGTKGHNWQNFFADFEDIFHGIQRHFGEAPTVGVFHSLSAVAALQHTLARGARWSALALFDPPIYPRDGHSLRAEHVADMTSMMNRSNRRPQSYRRPEDFAAQLARLPQFSRVMAEGPMLFARHTLRENAHGLWELCNPRELEAGIYLSQDDPTLWPRMRDLPVPVILIGGDPAVSKTPAAKVCAAIHAETGVEYAAIPDTTHFLQIEKPQACQEALLAFLKRHGLLNRQDEGDAG